MLIPSHLAIIMDGNGRWATERGLPRREGHKQGVETLKKIIKVTMELGISCLTVYAFSTENWKRPQAEVNFLMKLIQGTMSREAEEINSNNIRVNFIGRREELSGGLLREMQKIEKLTAGNEDLFLNIAFNYGGRAEIVDAFRQIYRENKDELDPAVIDEELIQKHLYLQQFPEVELLIRTGGEQRISNFLLWEIAYAELFFSEKFWPDFGESDLRDALKEFSNRERRFGGIDEAGDL